jgi:tol-pal system protein YbgF
MKTIALTLLALAPVAAFGQKKDQMLEIQRDIAQLQDQVRSMQRNQDEKLGQISLLLQQAIDASNKANTAVAVLNERFGEQSKSMVGPVTGMGTKVDQMSDEFRSVREAVADLTARMGKLDAKLSDVVNAVATLRNPPAAPPPGGGTSVPGGGSAATPPAGMSAEQSYQNAYRDMQGGQLDLAQQEFTDYLKYFPNTEYAPNAQFYLGDIALRKGDAEGAISAFDLVVERFSENPKTPDARYMKGRALITAGRPTAAAQEFRELIKRYPDSSVSDKAKAQLKALGYSAPTAAQSKTTKKKK